MAVEVLARPPLEVGDGRFVVVDELGEGGTAIVYLAYDRVEQIWVALKALLFKHLGNEEIRRRFNQEAATLGAFDHPNIPRLVAHAPLASPPYMAIELARRGTAMDWLREHGPMPPAMAIEVIDQVCAALQAAHAAGVVHRDVKPHNVLLFDGGLCKLSDFGIARVAENTSFTATGTQIGTFSFMAPEQRSDTKSVDAKADVYAVGASLYTLLTARTSAELFLGDPEDIVLAEITAPLREVILCATRYRADDRYATIDALRDGLHEAARRLSPSDSRAPPLLRTRTPLPRGPPAVLPPGRRFSDLERSLALDSSQATFISAIGRSLGREPPSLEVATGSGDGAPPEPLFERPHETILPDTTGMTRSAPDDPVRRWLAYGSGAGALAVAGMVLVLLVGAAQVWSATRAADTAGEQLVAALQADPELGVVLGADRLAYERRYDALLTATDRQERIDAAVACVALLEAGLERGPEPGVAAHLRSARDTRNAYESARATWTTIAATFPGSWAVAIGVARRPGS